MLDVVLNLLGAIAVVGVLCQLDKKTRYYFKVISRESHIHAAAANGAAVVTICVLSLAVNIPYVLLAKTRVRVGAPLFQYHTLYFIGWLYGIDVWRDDE